MKKSFSTLALLAAGAGAALFLGSCAYDPHYSSVSYGTSYGYGHGYGSSTFSTSVLISTGDPRWGYDPYSYAYYDYTRRAYYDPYLYAYYPVGYRPPVVIGVPHPHGWRRGRTMPPPSRVRSTVLTNYHDREAAYRKTNFSWARQARVDRSSFHPSPSRGGSQNPSRPAPGQRPGDRVRPPQQVRPQPPQQRPQPQIPQGRPSRNLTGAPPRQGSFGQDPRSDRPARPGVPPVMNQPIAAGPGPRVPTGRPNVPVPEPAAVRPAPSRASQPQAVPQSDRRGEREFGGGRVESPRGPSGGVRSPRGIR